MNLAELSKEEFAALAKEIYYRDIRPQVIGEHHGEFLVLDVESGDYEIAVDMLDAEDHLKVRRPQGRFYGIRIGFKAALSLGGHLAPDDGANL
ncbi:MAG TPA: hypothetical protein VGB77_05355 [Abditibacteriaceae bacterium]|jgi:hypothetical protein